ncbi:chromosomal replication initiator protein DnaA [Streptomyces spectabilis]|uniref:Chromosomal replication initiator protein DnaA n=1 Tax=Streptomyces spectabilis TaxID=68270 RepID=A0A516RIC4_STRST|nr:chromosomal replication initiator protein DnaA [Streptomyces spectabilis]QDQ15399.1 chromosomal replication initiator protein DnaA [Streptomyces spectabilis]
MGSLVPLGGELPEESRALAEALRRLFDGLGLSVRRYAARRSWDAGSLSRFLNGTRVPTWEFVNSLCHDVAEHQGRPPTPEAMELLRRLHREALARSGSPLHRVQLLEDQLAEADRQSTRSAALVRALEGALVDAQHRAADLEVQIGQLRAHQGREHADADKVLQLYEDQLAGLRRERQSLMQQVEALGGELRDAHTRRIEAEQRCEELERQLIAAEEHWQDDDTLHPEEARREPDDGPTGTAPGAPYAAAAPPSPPRPRTPGGNTPSGSLNPGYVFDTFIIGESNRFANAAALAAAKRPGRAYNPLFIYGTSGIGKTHLLHAAAHCARDLHPDLHVRYVHAEDFAKSRGDHRKADILLVDDLHFLAHNRPTQEEFLHTFNALHEAGKQIVLASDRPPKQLTNLEEGVRSRLEWGLITHMQPPELETRVALLHRKAAADGLNTPSEVLEFIATRTPRSIRELEGALNRVTAFANLNRQPVDIGLTEIVLKDLVPDRAPSRGERFGQLIITETSDYFGLAADDLCGTSRSRVLVTARQIAIYLCCELTDLPRPKICALFNRHDTAIVDHAARKIRALMAERRSIFNQITELTRRIMDAAD